MQDNAMGTQYSSAGLMINTSLACVVNTMYGFFVEVLNNSSPHIEALEGHDYFRPHYPRGTRPVFLAKCFPGLGHFTQIILLEHWPTKCTNCEHSGPFQ